MRRGVYATGPAGMSLLSDGDDGHTHVQSLTVPGKRARVTDVRRWTAIPAVIAIALAVAAAGTLLLEMSGAHTRLSIHIHGDVARESRWVGQFGQLSCVVATVAAVWLLDERQRRRKVIALIVASVLASSACSVLLKCATGRVRPSFDHAGQFLGPFADRDAANESFPLAHTASAFALGAVLSAFYPRGRAVWWVLAAGCGALRWVRDSHWLSDVLAGAALGLAVANVLMYVVERIAAGPPVEASAAAAAEPGGRA